MILSDESKTKIQAFESRVQRESAEASAHYADVARQLRYRDPRRPPAPAVAARVKAKGKAKGRASPRR